MIICRISSAGGLLSRHRVSTDTSPVVAWIPQHSGSCGLKVDLEALYGRSAKERSGGERSKMRTIAMASC